MNAPLLDKMPPPEVARARATASFANASSFLDGKRWREAEVEILRALALLPHDARALKLLALVRFKLGRLDEAETVCRELVAAHPDDPALRLKLGLIALKLDRVQDAIRELELAARLLPHDKRAWTYLGFAFARAGEPDRAVAAFQRGGQPSLAAQLSSPQGGASLPDDPEVSDDESDESDGSHTGLEAVKVERISLASATAGLGEGRIVSPGPPASPGTELEPAHSGDDHEALGDPSSPRPSPPSAPRGLPAQVAVGPVAAESKGGPTGSSQPVLSLLSFTLSRLGSLDRMASDGAGSALRLDFTRELHARASSVVAVTGKAQASWARRREQGRLGETPLGEADGAFLRFEGEGEVVLAAPHGVPVTLALDDDILYLRMHRLLAFDADVLWEAGRIPRTDLDMVQFRGDGRVVMALVGHPTAIKVTPQHPVTVSARSLVGWAGRIVARGLVTAGHPAGLAAGTPASSPVVLYCEGEGVVLADLFPPAHD